jgi:hypothetical protein
VLRWAWRFASAKPPYAYTIISAAFSIDAGIFYANPQGGSQQAFRRMMMTKAIQYAF